MVGCSRFAIIGLVLLAGVSLAASDVGMIGDEPSDAQTTIDTSASSLPDVGMVGEEPSAATEDGSTTSEGEQASTQDFRSFYLELNGGWFFRDLEKDSSLACPSGSYTGGVWSCSGVLQWDHGRSGGVLGLDLGVRYNSVFALELGVWRPQNQQQNVVGTTSYQKVSTWLASALYRAQAGLGAQWFVTPKVGVVFAYHKITGFANGVSVDAKTRAWRPAIGVGLLKQFSNHMAVSLNALYIAEGGKIPGYLFVYPSIQLLTLGVSYSF